MSRIADKITVKVEYHGDFEGYRTMEFELRDQFWSDPFVQALANKHDELAIAKARQEMANGPGGITFL